MAEYILNTNPYSNPNHNYEIHTVQHADQLHIPLYNRKYLGAFSNDQQALAVARALPSPYGPNADGCAYCCPSIHRR